MEDLRVRRLLTAFIVSGLFFVALPGTFIGVGNLLLIAMAHSPGAPSPAWIQAHGQAQLFGWVGSFILGISLFILPRFRGTPLASIALGWLTWALWTAGVAMHWLAGVGEIPAGGWLIVSAGLELAAFAASQYLLVIAPARAARAPEHPGGPPRSPARPRDLGSALGIAGFLGLGLTLLVNLVAACLVAPGSAAYPPLIDRMLLELSLWTFVLPIALGYSSRFVSRFLGLRPPHAGPMFQMGSRPLEVGRLLMGLVAIMAVLAITQAFAMLAIVSVVFTGLAIWALRIFEPRAHAAYTAGVYAGYPAFVRIAFGWLIAGALIGLAAAVAPGIAGLAGAGRHAITVGFIALLIFSLAPRLLPEFLHRRLFSRALMAGSLWLLVIGCTLRVASEAASYGTSHLWAWQLLPTSAYIELTAVLVFALNLGVTLARRPRAATISVHRASMPA